jgi:hypothetical protein
LPVGTDGFANGAATGFVVAATGFDVVGVATGTVVGVMMGIKKGTGAWGRLEGGGVFEGETVVGTTMGLVEVSPTECVGTAVRDCRLGLTTGALVGDSVTNAECAKVGAADGDEMRE